MVNQMLDVAGLKPKLMEGGLDLYSDVLGLGVGNLSSGDFGAGE